MRALGLLLLSVAVLLHIHSADAHGRKASVNATEDGSKAGAPQVRAVQVDPDALPAACVPKYVNNLLLPPPMPQRHEEDPGCFDFSCVRPPYCRKYGPYPQAEPYSSNEADPAAAVVSHKDPKWDRHDKPSAHHHHKGDGPSGKDHHHSSSHHSYEDDKHHHGRDRHSYSGDDDPSGSYGDRKHGKHDYYDYRGGHRDKSDYTHGEHDDPYYSRFEHHDYPHTVHTPPECEVDCFTEYQISAKPHIQQSLPATAPVTENLPIGVTCPNVETFGTTTVFAYGPTGGPQSEYNWPAFTIEALRYRPNRIQWTNELMNADRTFVQHILKEAVDQTLHWANPKGPVDESPCHGCTAANPCTGVQLEACRTAATTTYEGPVPIVTHVHGMEDVRDHSDGYTEAWYLPGARNLNGYNKVGSWYDKFKHEYERDTCQTYSRAPSSADYIYPNTQRPSTAWYHDHTLGLTRLNVYAGMAGFYFIRNFFPEYRPGQRDTGPELPGLPYPPPGGCNQAADVRELPLAIQDRMFKQDGSLWYPVRQSDATPVYPDGVQPPVWVPEFPFTPDVGDYIMMTVNGRVWPKTTIKQDTYRLRLLNGCNARVLQLRFAKTSNDITDFDYKNTATFTDLPFWVVGNEAGFFPQIQGLTELTMGPASRYDVIVDFTGVADTEFVYMYNFGPEEPFNFGGMAQTEFATPFTSQLMRFEFNSALTTRPSASFNAARQAALNAALAKEAPTPLPSATRYRQMALIEQNNPANPDVVKAVLLGTVPAGVTPPAGPPTVFTASEQMWSERVRTTTPVSTVEEWDIINLTADAHPIHLHEVVYETISRTGILKDGLDPNKFTNTGIKVDNQFIDPMLFIDCPDSLSPTGDGKCPAQVDVSLILPDTRTKIRFKTGAKPGLFVWHCHLVEHEDNEMMVPWCVGPPDYTHPKTGARMCPDANNLLVPQ